MIHASHLVILSDYGIDDAVALVYLLDHRDATEKIDILPIGGNVSREMAHRNACKLLAEYDGELEQVRLVDTSDFAQPSAMITEIHGEDGMGNLFADAPSPVPTVSLAAFRKEEGSYTLLSLGPCTLTRELLQDGKTEQLILMAGNVAQKPNYKGYEFNEALDPQAFAACVRYPHVAATLDTCMQDKYNFKGRTNQDGSLFQKVFCRACELECRFHPDASYVYDYLAARYLVHPEEFRKMQGVDLHGNYITYLL